ncbi:hypothetical protein [Paenibacillus daejeonensis]|uniref:hypothetical protein n=1 Tax=Paenibacillus daejeonensis TaxID=135193 RepID=UPI00037C8B2C|nr:hypothetical protein [Paenibacillus daejeonensis]
MMKNAIANLAIRKITAAYFATLMLSVGMAVAWLGIGPPTGSNGFAYVGNIIYIFGIYAGIGCLLYGTPVSLLIEGIARWLNKRIHLGGEPGQHDTPDTGKSAGSFSYVALHGIFGLIPGFIFLIPLLVLCGTAAAVLYALGDRWARYRLATNQGIKRIWLLPLVFALFVSILIELFMF